MPEDRLDDAIDAVVRAVDRIERATRAQRLIEGADPAGIADDAAAAAEAEIEQELRPPATDVAPGRDAWEPDPDAPIVGVRKKDKGKKKKHRHHAAGVAVPDFAAGPTTQSAQPLHPAPPAPAAPAPPAPVSAEADADAHAPAEVHELVGRIVARTQELDDQLEAARRLRGEINELVARLAAAATQR